MVTETQALTGKELLLRVARDLFCKDGYNGVSMQQIAEAAHMTKGSPYYHFKNKEDLFTQVFVREIKAFLAGVQAVIASAGTLEDRLFRSFRYVLTHGAQGLNRLSDDFDRYVLPHRDPHEKDLEGITVDSIRRLFDPLIEEAAAAGRPLRFSLERASFFLFVVTSGQNQVERMGLGSANPAADIDAYAADITEFVLHGLLVPDAAANVKPAMR
jgi:AcrR family transcriptional regulator